MVIRATPDLDRLWTLQVGEEDKHPYRGLYSAEWDKCHDYGLQPSIYFLEALAYHERAEFLQLKDSTAISGCPLQDNVRIYDTVNRWAAGFSNVPQEMFLGELNPKHEFNKNNGLPLGSYRAKFDDPTWFYLFLIHRICGSGASFAIVGDSKLPPHGWYNTPVPWLCREASSSKDIAYLVEHADRPMFSSIGNQIPPFPKPVPPFKTGGKMYLAMYAPYLAQDFYRWLVNITFYRTSGVSIQDAVDWALDWHVQHGLKKFKFVLTAWVMDIAEYFPCLVNPNSDCYHGKNAIEAIDLVFSPVKKMPKQSFYDTGTRFFADLFGTRPMDVEDAAPGCDLIRYAEQMVQKRGYDNIDRTKIFNVSHIRHEAGRQPWKLGTEEWVW